MNQTQTRSLRKKVLSLILAVVMVVSLLPISAFASGNSTSTTASGKDYYKILHLDCGRKYFSKDWIIALLNEMSADGYNQLQLAFGNDGLRFLLDDMSFTANGTTYSHKTVVSKVEAGNKLQNNSGDASWLTQTEMDEIIAAAKEKGIEIVPLLNLPGHANAILDIADDTYNASGSNNTLNVASSEKARNFGMAIFKKYVDYFAGKGCKFFNFGADEYANDASGTFSFSRLNSTQYATFVSFINSLAEYIENKGVTARAFNDGLYYNGQSASIDTKIQCCYWSCGWGSSYPVAPAKTIASKGHDMINTNGDYYYVLGEADTFDSDYSSASNFSNAGFMGSTVNSPVGSMFCIWSDYPNAETEQVVAQKVRLPMRAMALRMNGESIDRMDTSVVANGFNADGTLNRAATGGDNTYTSEVDINLTVGQTSDVYTQAGDVTGKVNKDGFNETVASIDSLEYANVEGKTERTIGTKQSSFSTSGTTGVITDAAGHYMVIDSSGNITSTDDINAATVFTVKKTSGYDSTYSIQGNGYYLQLTSSGIVANSKSGSSFNYATYNGFYVSIGNYYRINYRINYSNGSWGTARTTNGDYTGAGQLYSYTESTTPATNATQITFKGNAVGETSVIIGSVKYNIIVSDKAPDDALTADTITLEHWITNARVAATSGATGDDRNVQKISKTTAGIQSEDGVAVEKLAYTPYGYWGDTKVYYWQGMKLDKNNVQTDASGDDETADGTTLTHIRYYGNAWQYKTADETWHYFQNTDQFVIYYLQKTEVTKEVDTYVKDWGFDTKETTKDWSDGKGQVALTIAVVYPNGTVSPVESSMYSNSTIIYNYVDGRDIGIVAPKNNSDYNIAKITVTDGTRDSNSSSNVWYPYDTITWDKTTDSATGKTWYNETEVWNKSSGTTPMVNGKNSNITWAAKNTAKLVLIYLETVERETNLNVVYWDDNAGVKITGSQIAMKFTQGDTEPSFKTDLKGVTAGVTSWPSKDKSSSDYLPDTAYVTNSSGVDQTFNKDLVTVPGVTGVYTSGLYEYVSADISDDGKTLTLHYNLRQVEGKTYVLDFGLPIEIPITDFFAFENDSLKNSVTDISFESSTSVTEKQGEYGKGKIDKSTGIVTYTLTKALDSKVAIPVFVTLNDAAKTVKRLQVYIIPATSVYYEDSFATFTNANGTKNVAQVDNAAKGTWTKVTDGTTQTNVNQALEELGGTTNTKNVYGYDPAYADSSKFSMGSATKVTVDANTADNSQWPTATFTFKGTGFDVISLTNSDSGTVVYTVTNKSNGKSESHIINNYYGYRYDETTGKWVVANNDSTAPYQVPVIKVSGLAYDTYEVTISVIYGALFDNTGDHQYSFWLDAIRVYDPAGATLNTEYAKDNENAPDYVRIKQVILDSKALKTDGATGAVFIDGKGANGVTAADYTNQGPNHEAYLAKEQAIAFQLIASAKPTSVQIGAKLASGNSAGLKIGGAACAKANGGTLTLNTATDMYYELTNMDWQKDGEVYKSNVITLTNAGSGIISLTNLKFIGAKYTGSLPEVKSATSETNLVTLAVSSEMIDEALTTVDGALNPAPETFEPSHFEADWNRSVRAGQKATLTVKTSEDVDAITVDGQTITTYRTRTERTGWGWWSPRVTYRVFTYTTTAQATADYEVCALNSSGVASEPITATLTVKPAINWWHKWF